MWFKLRDISPVLEEAGNNFSEVVLVEGDGGGCCWNPEQLRRCRFSRTAPITYYSFSVYSSLKGLS